MPAKLFPCTTGQVELPFTEMNLGSMFLGKDQELSLGYAEFEKPWRHPRERCLTSVNLEFREKVWAEI